ncbi:MAG: ATPase, partial [Candidatus Aenigmatarchaeota archaeon]
TKEAGKIVKKYKAERKPEGGKSFGNITQRVPVAGSFDPRKGRKPVKISPKGVRSIMFGIHHIDLSGLEQLVDTSQTRAIGDAIYFGMKHMDGKRTLKEIIEEVLKNTKENGLDSLNSRPIGDYAVFRGIELASAINRLRTLSVKQKS